MNIIHCSSICFFSNRENLENLFGISWLRKHNRYMCRRYRFFCWLHLSWSSSITQTVINDTIWRTGYMKRDTAISILVTFLSTRGKYSYQKLWSMTQLYQDWLPSCHKNDGLSIVIFKMTISHGNILISFDGK